MTRVAVIGAGSWGTTVASLLAERVPTVLWSRSESIANEVREHHTNRTYLEGHLLSSRLAVTSSLREALEETTLIITAVPSHGLRSVLAAVGSECAPGVPVLSLSKGLEESTNKRMSEVIDECWPGRSIAVLTGPNLAPEILAGLPTASVVGCGDESFGAELQGLLTSETLRIYTNHDVVGCEISGVVKNVMAIASGMSVGLGLGDNARAALITRALAELSRLGVALGGEQQTFAGLAGLGDLVATCVSETSRNFRVGLALGRGRRLDEALGATPMVAEGVRSSGPLVALARRLDVEVPIAEQVYAVCYEGRAPKDTIPRLMLRRAKSEFEGMLAP